MKAIFTMHKLYLQLLMLEIIIARAKSAALTEDTTTGWFDESQINTDHTTLQDSRPYRKLKGRVTFETEHENDEERGGLKWLMKKPAIPTTLPTSPISVAKVVQESPDVVKVNPRISQTVRKMQKDKDLLKEMQSSPMLSRMQGSFRKNPSKKITEADVKKLGLVTTKSIKSSERWRDNPEWILALGVLVVILLAAGSLAVVSAVN